MKSVKTRMHSSRMHTAPLLTIFRSAQGGLPPGCRPPGCRPPDADIPLGCRSPLDADPPGHVTCDACWEAAPLVNRMIHRCKNITLPQTLFAGGNQTASKNNNHNKHSWKVIRMFWPQTPLLSNFLFIYPIKQRNYNITRP